MNNEIIHFDVKDIEQRARVEFRRACGFEDGNEKHIRMEKQAEQVLQDSLPYIRPVAIVSAFGPEALQGDTATLGGIAFQCNAFARVNPASVEKIYAYIISAGEIPLDEDNALQMLFGDMWGTAYTDATLDALKDYLAEAGAHPRDKLTAAFGPGFYGMEITTIPQFFELLDGEAIGVQVRHGSYMLPLKSCAGFMVAAKDLSAFPPSDCENCIGGRSGCAFCRNNPAALRQSAT